SFFDVIKDETLQSKYSKNDPRYATDKSGRINDVQVWWVDYSVKLATQKLFDNDDIGFMAGYQFNHSYLDLDSWSSDNVENEEKTSVRNGNANGGSTETHSFFAQTDWDVTDQLNVMAGVRYDHWAATRGHIKNVDIDNRDASRISPKFSLEYRPMEALSARYSFTKAYRFPVAEELFESSTNTNSVNISNPNLGPETGYFHDFRLQYDFETGGYASATFFYNNIENEILRTSTLLANGSTKNLTRSIDETEALGIEVAYVQDYIFDLPLALSLNGTWLNKEFKKDSNTTTNEGNEWPRIPQWRANGTLTYHATENWDNIVAVQYRSSQFGQDDNSDKVHNVYGSSDSYVLVNFKTAYSMDVGNDVTAKFSVGIDNILNENYYDHHPYPQRTYFANIALDI
ncbi:MAG: TonB-dependent receptor, partial [Methylococcaceae bacterium]|nr:TonB-dependent receptor [Methylococcaceae bacterium]